ncbi:hypothetical protein ACIOK3_49195, partial [Streptomyces mirabilis]
WLSYSVGMTITDAIHQAVLKIPKKAWTPAYDADGTERPGDGTHERARLLLAQDTSRAWSGSYRCGYVAVAGGAGTGPEGEECL